MDKLSELYNYSVKLLEMKLERKRHLEIKCLYVLQAAAILVTLYLGLVDKINVVTTNSTVLVVILKILFYLAIAITLFLLLISLNDGITNFFKPKEAGAFRDTILPELIMNEHPEDTVDDFHENLIRDFSQSIASADDIIEVKTRLFNKAVTTFIIAVIILIILGFCNI